MQQICSEGYSVCVSIVDMHPGKRILNLTETVKGPFCQIFCIATLRNFWKFGRRGKIRFLHCRPACLHPSLLTFFWTTNMTWGSARINCIPRLETSSRNIFCGGREDGLPWQKVPRFLSLPLTVCAAVQSADLPACLTGCLPAHRQVWAEMKQPTASSDWCQRWPRFVCTLEATQARPAFFLKAFQ